MLFQFYGGRFGVGFFQSLERLGFIDAIFPFALVFTVVYGILRKIQIFGKDATNRFDVVIALFTAVAFVYPHISGRYGAWGIQSPVDIINQAIPQIGVIIIAVVMFLILIGTLGWKGKFGMLQQIMAALSVFVVFGIFLNAAGLWRLPDILRFLADPDLQAFIVVALTLGALLWFLSSDPKSPGAGKGLKNFLDAFIDKPQ